MLMSKDPSRIIHVLDFLSKQLDQFKDKKDYEEDYKKRKKFLGIEKMEGVKKIMFYNVPCKVLDGKSLLE